MLTKQPVSKVKNLKKYLGITAVALFAIEGIGFAISYGVWYKLNTEREFRLHMYKNYNWVLQSFYKLEETFGSKNTRELDHKVWTNEGKI